MITEIPWWPTAAGEPEKMVAIAQFKNLGTSEPGRPVAQPPVWDWLRLGASEAAGVSLRVQRLKNMQPDFKGSSNKTYTWRRKNQREIWFLLMTVNHLGFQLIGWHHSHWGKICTRFADTHWSYLKMPSWTHPELCSTNSKHLSTQSDWYFPPDNHHNWNLDLIFLL
jgi:hypothetical protein